MVNSEVRGQKSEVRSQRSQVKFRFAGIGLIFFVLFVLNLTACARVRVEAPKEPIKVDISMRLDIYQHIENDINSIENIVSGSSEKPKPAGNNSLLGNFITSAYAQDELSPEVQQAALRRKDRYSEITSLEQQGIIGESRLGLLEIRKPEAAGPQTQELIKAENSDRMIIYEEIAKKNGTGVDEVQALYAKRLQSDAPSGTPIEVLNQSSGNYEWTIK